jgi:hydroxymethylglutaryl-CoA lyase
MTAAVELVEVSARDGLQNEPEMLATEQKLDLIARSVAAGLKRLEVASFVNPKKVPQMADAAEVMAGLPKADGVTYIALALNRRGFERAAEAGAREVNFVLAASDSFAMRNSGATMLDLVAVLAEVSNLARNADIRVSATISVAFGCPFEGEVPARTVGDRLRLPTRLASACPRRCATSFPLPRRRRPRRSCALISTIPATQRWRTSSPPMSPECM